MVDTLLITGIVAVSLASYLLGRIRGAKHPQKIAVATGLVLKASGEVMTEEQKKKAVGRANEISDNSDLPFVFECRQVDDVFDIPLPEEALSNKTENDVAYHTQRKN
jgi:hypothetical protein